MAHALRGLAFRLRKDRTEVEDLEWYLSEKLDIHTYISELYEEEHRQENLSIYTAYIKNSEAFRYITSNHGHLLERMAKESFSFLDRPVAIVAKDNGHDALAACGIRYEDYLQLRLRLIKKPESNYETQRLRDNTTVTLPSDISGGREVDPMQQPNYVKFSDLRKNCMRKCLTSYKRFRKIQEKIAIASIALFLGSVIIGWIIYFLLPEMKGLVVVPSLMMATSCALMVAALQLHEDSGGRGN